MLILSSLTSSTDGGVDNFFLKLSIADKTVSDVVAVDYNTRSHP